jgi:histidine triad (HIT) family protein
MEPKVIQGGDQGGSAPGACVFCRIIAGEKDEHFIHADAHTVSFLDHNPVFPGHILVVPRIHHVSLPDLPPGLLAPLFGHAQRIARALEKVMGLDGTFLAINNRVGQSVSHLHVHVIPRREGDGMRDFHLSRKDFGDAIERADTVRVLSEYMAAFPD